MNYSAAKVADATAQKFPQMKEDMDLKLTIETRNTGEILIVHAQGSLVRRDEPSDLVRVLSDIFQHTSRVVLDVSGLVAVDGSGLGELAQAQSRACASRARLSIASPSPMLRHLLSITNLDSAMEVQDSVGEAVESLLDEAVTADC